MWPKITYLLLIFLRVHIEAKKTLNIFMVGNKNLINKILIFLQVKRTLCYSHGVKVLRPFIELDRQYHIFQWLENPKVSVYFFK